MREYARQLLRGEAFREGVCEVDARPQPPGGEGGDGEPLHDPDLARIDTRRDCRRVKGISVVGEAGVERCEYPPHSVHGVRAVVRGIKNAYREQEMEEKVYRCQ